MCGGFFGWRVGEAEGGFDAGEPLAVLAQRGMEGLDVGGKGFDVGTYPDEESTHQKAHETDRGGKKRFHNKHYITIWTTTLPGLPYEGSDFLAVSDQRRPEVAR